ncbi:MAG: lipopolysaccharide biosynthesis protein RfbH [Planctomycetales bacterium]|nr:lipopolysaccharide biosynthesis protein RfbH [Planctomycetales bacterium]
MSREDEADAESRLTDEILDRVRQIARRRVEAARRFEPGKTPVKYAGRVYDEAEMVNLVRSSLEFWLTGGHWHQRFERELARWYGVPHARLVNSGSSANLLAVAALTSPRLADRRLRPGDEVLTVAAGFPTTVFPLLQHALVPVLVDVTLPGYNADPAQLEAAVTPRTRAVMLAHTLGNPFDLDAVLALCRRRGLWLVEDNCDAAGSLYRGRKTGTFGDLSTLSFYPPHHMTTGEGGAVLTSDPVLDRLVDSLRDWGRDCWCAPGVDNTCGQRFGWKLGELPEGYDHKYIFSQLGYNLKMTDLQASVGLAQLEKLDGFGAARRANWRYFHDALADLADVFWLPEPTEGSDPSWFGFVLTVRPDAPFTRDEIVQHLESRKIQTRMLFAGNLARQPVLAEIRAEAARAGGPAPFRVSGELRNADLVMSRTFWVGVYPGLSESMRSFVAEEIRSFVRSRRGPA